MGDLKKILDGELQKWTNLEDLAVQSDPGSFEFGEIKNCKEEDSINKRRKFFECE